MPLHTKHSLFHINRHHGFSPFTKWICLTTTLCISFMFITVMCVYPYTCKYDNTINDSSVININNVTHTNTSEQSNEQNYDCEPITTLLWLITIIFGVYVVNIILSLYLVSNVSKTTQ